MHSTKNFLIVRYQLLLKVEYFCDACTHGYIRSVISKAQSVQSE